LDELLKKLKNINKSLFSGDHKLIQYKDLFNKELSLAIKDKSSDENYFKKIKPYLENPKKLKDSEKFKKEILGSDKFPFKSLNDWFKEVVIAVDKEIIGKDKEKAWDKANKLYEKINRSKLPKGIKPLNKRPLSDKICWVNKENSQYKKITSGTNKFDKDGWDALVRRTDRKYFYDFRHNALISLLKELN
jgi:hypothetical protein